MSHTPQYLSPRAVAERLDIDQDLVYAWINRGELRASDVSERRGGKARWRISLDDLEVFLARRSAKPLPRVRRRRQPQNVKQYF